MARPELVRRYVELKRGIEKRREENEKRSQKFQKDYAPIINDAKKVAGGISKRIGPHLGPGLKGPKRGRSSEFRMF